MRDGVAIDFEARPAGGATELVEGGLADIRFRISAVDAAGGRTSRDYEVFHDAERT